MSTLSLRLKKSSESKYRPPFRMTDNARPHPRTKFIITLVDRGHCDSDGHTKACDLKSKGFDENILLS